jgi:hypothetical protein
MSPYKEFRMKINATKSWLFVTLLSAAVLCTSGAVHADDSNLDRANEAVGKAKLLIQELQPGQQPQSPQNPPFGNNPFGRGGSTFFSSGRPGTNVASAIRKAAEAVRDAKGDEAKSEAQKKLAELLSKSYDDDMVQREHELKQIEERLAKLRELLERRRTKKQEVIELQTKVALNEADGLGFYDNERPAKASAFGYSLPQVDAAGGTISVSTSGGEIPAPAAPPAPTTPRAAKAVSH